MNARRLTAIGALVLLTGVGLRPSLADAGQGTSAVTRPSSASPAPTRRWSPARTPWGDPDLQGVYTNTDEFNVPLERPDRFKGRKVTDITAEELAEFTRQSNDARRRAFEQNNAFRGLAAGNFDLRPSRAWLVVDPPDGRIPPLTTEGQQRQAAFAARLDAPPESAEALNLWYRCISLGVPRSMMPSQDGAPFRIVQAPGFVTIVYERMHEARVIPVGGLPHVGRDMRSYVGDARGSWEDNTLVVETTNFRGEFQMTSAASKNLRVVERFTPAAPRSLEWSVTIDDPAGWTRPWTFTMLLKETKEQLFEDGCHEGNHVIRNILTAARADERRGR